MTTMNRLARHHRLNWEMDSRESQPLDLTGWFDRQSARRDLELGFLGMLTNAAPQLSAPAATRTVVEAPRLGRPCKTWSALPPRYSAFSPLAALSLR